MNRKFMCRFGIQNWLHAQMVIVVRINGHFVRVWFTIRGECVQSQDLISNWPTERAKKQRVSGTSSILQHLISCEAFEREINAIAMSIYRARNGAYFVDFPWSQRVNRLKATRLPLSSVRSAALP